MDFDELISNTADGVCAVTSEGKITLWNRSAEKILGYPAREVVGQPCCEVFVGRDVAGNRLCYRGCHVQTMEIRPDGVERAPNFTALVASSCSARPRLWAASGRSVTGGPSTVIRGPVRSK